MLHRHPAVPYVAPFALFVGILAVKSYLPVPEAALYGIWTVAIGIALLSFSRHVLDLRLRNPLGTILIGVAVFLIWIGPDVLAPGYRSHWLFQNRVTGQLSTSITEAGRVDLATVILRVVRAVALVPMVEELFWRAFLMRWLINPNFESVPLGKYAPAAFWITAFLFASEHGPYWDVGLAAGAIYNYWLIRTRSLGDVIWAHAITNGALSAYVILAHKWAYWM